MIYNLKYLLLYLTLLNILLFHLVFLPLHLLTHKGRIILKYLKYPPIVITELDGEWGASFTDIEFIGYDKNLKEVARRKFLKNPTYDDILVRIYTDTLDSKYLDATRVCVFAIDKEGNTLPFVNDIIELEVDGDIEIIGKQWENLLKNI